ncbi:hypothetical protein VAR608DRAFT_6992 [Variovorax sp. HW608]|uniref:hypothetical protein n=1 Tax=Variovorax sp. HW608 TaxID=1034889 RepID=UPI00081FD5F0|nr:hypothetical protein [Variovorax sp. HW608]SCK61175.1 hypothetical protein VAR608DRAFT_6992 [Variovorax sp. HW608]
MIQISTALNDYRLGAVINFLAIGTTNASVRIYDGARPALGGTPTGNLLSTILLVEPIGEVADGLLTVTPTGEALIETSGQATWARIVNGDGALAWDCDVSDQNGTGELRLPSTTLYAGGYTRIVSGLLG